MQWAWLWDRNVKEFACVHRLVCAFWGDISQENHLPFLDYSIILIWWQSAAILHKTAFKLTTWNYHIQCQFFGHQKCQKSKICYTLCSLWDKTYRIRSFGIYIVGVFPTAQFTSLRSLSSCGATWSFPFSPCTSGSSSNTSSRSRMASTASTASGSLC